MHLPLLLIVPPGKAQTLPLCPWDKENILQAQSQPKGIRITRQTLPQLENASACVPTTAYPVWHMPCGFPNTEFRVGTLFCRFQWRCWQRLKTYISERMQNGETMGAGWAWLAAWPQNTCWEIGRVGPASSRFLQFPYNFSKAEGGQ